MPYLNRTWFSLVCTLISNNTRHHSGQNLTTVMTHGLLSIRVQTTLHIQFVKY